MNKYHPYLVKGIHYMFAKLSPESTNFSYKLSEISAMCLIPIVDVYKMAQDYFSVDFSDKIKTIEKFYA